MTLNDKSSPEEIKATFGHFQGAVQKGSGWLDESEKNQARPVWNGTNLRGALCENHFTLG